MIKWGPEAPKENRLQGMDFKQLNSRVFDQFCEKAVKYFFLNLAFDIRRRRALKFVQLAKRGFGQSRGCTL
jgi:hypothetical protein